MKIKTLIFIEERATWKTHRQVVFLEITIFKHKSNKIKWITRKY
jgi:hypothetical protein